VTVPPSHFRSFPALFALAALDKAFYRRGIHVPHAYVVRTVLARRASDHLPLVIDFHLAAHARVEEKVLDGPPASGSDA
jgi:endonuclease/exonuclease/phosphatase family metal-dependent hydrolase